jgi:hypothetical protein
MTREEGTNNVTAHRGYLDIVLTDFDIQGFGAPPTFEAEWIQDGASSHDYDTYRTFDGGASLFDPDWQSGVLYARANPLLKWYSNFSLAEFYSIDNSIIAAYFLGLRYSANLNRLVYLAGFTAPGLAYLVNPVSGLVIDTSDDGASSAGLVQQTVAMSDINAGAVYVGFTDAAQIFAFYFTDSSAVRSYQSSAAWGGYSSIQCVTPGEVRGSDLDFYFCADADLVKVTLTQLGTIKTTSVLATLAHPLRYAVYDGGDLVVWTDSATVSRVNGTTGAVEYTMTVPYQIPAVATRNMGDPDQHRLTEEMYFTTGGVSYFTDLKTGATRSLTGANASPNIWFYDGQTGTVVTRDNAFVPQRLRFITGAGDVRQLSDLLTDLMVYGGGYDPSQVATENIDDLIQGAVFDITAGTRDIARSIIEPYSIALFERSGVIIFKRALTD